MDVMNMVYEDRHFDVVIDKACFDAIVCGDNSLVNATQMVSEVYRVLNDGGSYICISNSIPEKRLNYFE